MSRPAALAMFISVAVGVSGCGPATVTLDGYDVLVTKTSECTVTGQLARNCEDEAVLAQTSLQARWLIETANDGQSVTVTTHEGRTIPGLTFDNDESVITTEGCAGEGGRCVFVRRRFQTTDANNNGCGTFGELIFVGHFPPDDPTHLTGRFSDVAGNTEACGTPTINEVVFSVEGDLVDQPARSLQEAQP